MVLIADDRSFCAPEIGLDLDNFQNEEGMQNFDTADPDTVSVVVSDDDFGDETEEVPTSIFAAPFDGAFPTTLIGRWLVKFCVFVLAVYYATTQVVQLYSGGANKESSPKSSLANFVRSKQAEVNLLEANDIGELQTDSFDTFAATYCMEGPSLQQSREVLAVGLRGIPKDVSKSIVDMALHEGVTATNSWRNSNADLVNTNTAHSYMAFYSTNFHSNYDGSEKYSTCVMVTGVTFSVAETVAAYKYIEEEYNVGFDLECGWLSCWKVPRFATRKLKVPEFNRRTLSLKQQKELHTWMLQEAIDSAGHLVGIGSGVKISAGGGEQAANAWKYDPPNHIQSEL